MDARDSLGNLQLHQDGRRFVVNGSRVIAASYTSTAWRPIASSRGDGLSAG
jgi:hypothetical protein